MATKKDLVEAHAFSRRRLVTAFLSGAPGGREVEPSRPGRTIVGGLALALLVIATGAILAVLVGRTQEGWQDNRGIVIVKQPTSLYAVLSGTKDGGTLDLRPLLNSVSGQLIFGSDVTTTVVSAKTISGYTPGAYIGIANAPNQVPTPDHLLQTGWTACVDDKEHLSVDVAAQPPVSSADGTGFVVSDEEGHTYLIARSSSDQPDPQAYSYELPKGPAADTVLGGIGITTAVEDAVPVPDAWLHLFPSGGTLDQVSFARQGFGRPVKGRGTNHIPADAKYGDYLRVDDDLYVFTLAGPARLDPFAASVYLGTLPTGKKAPHALTGTIAPGGLANQFFDLNHWPVTTLQTFPSQVFCARLDTAVGAAPEVQMAQNPTGVANPVATQPVMTPQRFVDPGHGAFVYTGDFTDTTSTTPIVIDPRGDAYQVEGAQSIINLGYTMPAPLVPDTWAKLFDRVGGTVVLSRARALCAPDADPNDTCTAD